MSTRGLLSFRFLGQDYITYNHCDSYPKHLGARVVFFAKQHLHCKEAIQAFGRKVAALAWVPRDREAGSSDRYPQGGDLLEAIAKGEVTRTVREMDFSSAPLDCEFSYVLDLDKEVLEFWDLAEKVGSHPLATVNPCTVGVMECERRR